MRRVALPVKRRLIYLSLPWPNQPSMIRPVTWSLRYPSPTQYPETRTHNPDPESDLESDLESVDPDLRNPNPNRAQDPNLARLTTSLILEGRSWSISDCLQKRIKISVNSNLSTCDFKQV